MSDNKQLKYALYYARMGLRVFPCQPRGKRPATAHGCLEATTDPERIGEWWAAQPYNIGLATGGSIVVLDVDVDHDAGKYGDETLAELERVHGVLPDTWTSLTGGGGTHYFFSCNDPALTVGVEFAPGLDYRGAGGYVIAPGSVHESGREYLWEVEHTPTNCQLAPLPEWLHRLMLARKRPQAKPTEAPDTWNEGQRNDGLFRMACSLRSKGLTEAGIIAALIEENRARCSPPLPEKEVRTIAGSAGKYQRGEAKGEEIQRLDVISAPDLQRASLPPVRYIVEGMLPEGTSILSAASKVGKSWMVLHLGLNAAAGRDFMGHSTTPCGVLYLALEDSLSRLQNRMNKILRGQPAPEKFHFTTQAPTLDAGLLDTLDDHLIRFSDTSLVIIDTLQKIRGQALPREAAYAQDYREMGTIKAHMDKKGVSVLFVHHNRKMKDDDDPFNMISGTNAIMGAADTIWTITKAKRADDEATLHITGRDVESSDTVIRFSKESWTWEPLGSSDWLTEQRARLEYDNSPIVKTIKKLLEQSPEKRWDGTAKQLLNAGKYIAKTYLAPTPQELGYAIKKLDKHLFDYDGIIHVAPSNGTGGKRHHFYYQDVGFTEDAEAEGESPWSNM